MKQKDIDEVVGKVRNKSSLYEILLTDSLKEGLRQIDRNIEKLKEDIQKIEDIKKQKGYLNVEDRYKRNYINYYIKKNKQAEKDILEFLSNKIKIPAYIDGLEQYIPFGGNSNFLYHRFMSNIKQYNKNNFLYLDLDNKMMELPIYILEKVKKELKKELYNAEEYNILEYLRAYMEHFNMIDNIKKFIDNNHFLNRRKEVLYQIFKHLDNQDYISINNMLPLQIEGLFHDYCILIGIKEKELNISALNAKLDRIKEKNSNSLFAYIYEYFSFKFPIIRNRIAHGRDFNTNNEYQAISLIHDLYSVCQMLVDKNIELNQYIELLREINTNNNEFKNRLKLLKYIKIPLDKFYIKELKKLEIIKKQYKEERFLKDFEEHIFKCNSKESYSKENENNLEEMKKRIGLIKKYSQGDKPIDFLFEKISERVKILKEEEIEREKRLNEVRKILSSNKN